MDRKRDIFIRVEKIGEIVETLNVIKNSEKELKSLFDEYDRLNLIENKTFENWSNYLEDVNLKLDHSTL